MPLGINPLNDFAFMKTFGTPENREPLARSAERRAEADVADRRRDNPKSVQLQGLPGRQAFDSGRQGGRCRAMATTLRCSYRCGGAREKRLVYYGCELYVDQLREGADYAELLPAYSIWLLDGVLWPKTPQFHHAFRLTDGASGRVLDRTLAIHTLELPKYNTAYSDCAPTTCWAGGSIGCGTHETTSRTPCGRRFRSRRCAARRRR